ncbi:MAG: tetratricopeptide repeat protein [Thalassobaculales bacterium]
MTAAATKPAAKALPRPYQWAVLREGDKLRAENKPTEAWARYEGLLTSGADLPEVEARLAEMEIESGRVAAARSRMDRLMKANADPAAVLLLVAARLASIARDHAGAEQLSRRALAKAPRHPEAMALLGSALLERGQPAEAAAMLEGAINLRPHFQACVMPLQRALRRLGRRDRAEGVLRAALQADRDNVRMLVELANILHEADRLEESHAIHERLVSLPDVPDYVFANFGALCRKMGRFAEGRRHLRQALRRQPSNPGAFYNAGNLAKEQSRFDEAARLYAIANALAPKDAAVHWNRSWALIGAGRLREGFREYEWRWRFEGFPTRWRNFDKPPLSKPQWRGEPYPGRTLFVWSEQGLGDALWFARYLPLIAARGGRMVLEAHDALARLFAAQDGVETCVSRDQPGGPPPFDLHMPLMSAAHVLGTHALADIPGGRRYLKVPPGAGFALPGARADRLKVGLVWAGNPAFANDRNRSAGLAAMAPLFAVPGVQFYALQKGPGEGQIGEAAGPIEPLGQRLADMADTAAIIDQLDLVISTDTSVPHLAGALGRPVWLALMHAADFRWMGGREDSPWYPSMRLFRQPAPGDWASVFAAMAAALRITVQAHHGGAPGS